MNSSKNRFWPFKPRASIVSAITLLVLLMLGMVLLQRSEINWPSQKSETTILIGIFLISLLPILLALIDIIIERGGAIGFGGMKFDFYQVSQTGMADFTVPTNIGSRNQAASSTTMPDILIMLKDSMSCDVAVVDIQDGQKWWETRLLVLLAGAVRLNKPGKIVFVGNQDGKNGYFMGWSHPRELLPLLLKDHPKYLLSYHSTQSAARKWGLVEPINPVDPANPKATPPRPSWMGYDMALTYGVSSFDQEGLPNEFLAEQLLAYDLGQTVEGASPKFVNQSRLEELFRDVLYKEVIDEGWLAERQLSIFMNSTKDYLVATRDGKYTRLFSRLVGLNAIVRNIVEKK